MDNNLGTDLVYVHQLNPCLKNIQALPEEQITNEYRSDNTCCIGYQTTRHGMASFAFSLPSAWF